MPVEKDISRRWNFSIAGMDPLARPGTGCEKRHEHVTARSRRPRGKCYAL